MINWCWLAGGALACAVSLGCASERYAPLTHYPRLECSSLAASYDEWPAERERAAADDRVIDPTLGWVEVFGIPETACNGAAPQTDEWKRCRSVDSLVHMYTMVQERPLTSLGPLTSYRTVYRHSLGTTVVLRATRQGSTNTLIAKVIQGPSAVGPLAWVRVRALSDAEWNSIAQRARALPVTAKSYQDWMRPRLGTEKQPIRCFQEDGASIIVESYDGDEFGIFSTTYKWGSSRASAAGSSDHWCTHPRDIEASRFHDYLLSLVRCPGGTPAFTFPEPSRSSR